MNKLTRNLILPAAALAALLLAPASEARDVARGNGHDARVQERYEHGGRWHGHPNRPYWAAPYPAYRRVAPYRVVGGYHFYSARPGPRYVYVTGYGWVLPPFFGAVWAPAHYTIGGVWVGGFWR